MTSRPIHRTLTPPGVYLMRMFVFLALVSFVAVILSPQLVVTFKANPALNALIAGVLLFGILFAFRQVIRLYPEIRWVNAFRIADPGLAIEHKPVLLAPMATMLRDRTGAVMLSTTSMRSIMDSIASRLDEARDIGRYLVALLVFLGLLGTFWGLLDTIQSVGQTISALDTKANESALVFEELKAGLAGPLRGMGTAFSSSLLGLSGSLVIGFLELQANQAHNRFYNELEEWLSGITELTPAGATGSDQLSHKLYNAMFEVQRSVSELNERLGASGVAPASANDSVRELAHGVNQLVSQMRQEQNIVRQWVDEQAAQSQEVASVLKDIATKIPRRSA
ncbi:MAG TPA: flagellar motor protein MotA [Hyphomicrobiaceae bacterium]|nr:flagellar motor protein MotA [Hyphomicrobiaceae bacterium]